MKYKDAIVAFYDILGFGHYIENNKDEPQKVHDLFKRIASSAKFDERATKVDGRRFIHFSDTFVRTTPIFDEKGKPIGFGSLFNEILSAIHIQIQLVANGEGFLRGSITHGKIQHSNTEIFGPALVAAYKLETESAVFPRIIVDPETLKAVRDTGIFCRIGHDSTTNRKYCEELLRQGDDGIWFVEYLHHAVSELGNDEDYLPFLGEHKKAIIQQAEKAEKISKISHKYTWLAKYHNDIVLDIREEYFREHACERETFLITENDMPIIHRISQTCRIRWVWCYGVNEIMKAKGSPISEREALCKYLKQGVSAGFSKGELVDWLRVSSPSILDEAHIADDDQIRLMTMLETITDFEIKRVQIGEEAHPL